jgi:O-antigen ligase
MSVHVATLGSRNHRVNEVVIAAGLILVSVATGVGLAIEPVLALLPIAALASACLLVDGRARIVFVVLGGLFVFQREQGLDMSKMAFLALFAVAFVGAFLNVRTLRDSPAYRLARPLLVASTAFAVLAGVSLVIAHNNGTPLVGWWLRDTAPYLLFASAPIFALDAQAAVGRRRLVALLVTAGMVGAVAFAIHWLERRGIANFQAETLGLASHFVPAALFAYAMSAALHARSMRWLAVAAPVLALLLVTGTRTNLVLFVAPVAIALATRRHRATRMIRLALIGPIAVAITLVIGLGVLRIASANEEYLTKRISIFKSTGSSSDASYIERRRQMHAAWEVFKENPILGSGPGTIFEWQTIDRKSAAHFLIDTPLTFPAKFGLLGLVILIFVVRQYWLFMRALIRARDATAAYLGLVGYLAIVVVSAIALSPFENKGFSFGLILLLALVLSEVHEGRSSGGRLLPSVPRAHDDTSRSLFAGSTR